MITLKELIDAIYEALGVSPIQWIPGEAARYEVAQTFGVIEIEVTDTAVEVVNGHRVKIASFDRSQPASWVGTYLIGVML